MKNKKMYMLAIWDKINHELLPTEDNTNSIRKSTVESIITPLRKTVLRIESHNKLVLRVKENNLIINIAGILWRVLANQNIKFGNLYTRLIYHIKKGNIDSFIRNATVRREGRLKI